MSEIEENAVPEKEQKKEEEADLQRPPFLRSALPAAALVVAVLFVLPVGPLLLWPYFEERLAGPIAMLAYHGLICVAFVALWTFLHIIIAPDLPEALARREIFMFQFRLQWRTGMTKHDAIALFLSVVAMTALIVSGFHPWATAPGLVAFGITALLLSFPKRQWDLVEDRRPVQVPETSPSTWVSEDDAEPRVLTWEYKPLFGQGFVERVELYISRSKVEELRNVNPTKEALPKVEAGIRQLINLLIDGALTNELRLLAAHFLESALNHRLSVFEELESALQMIHLNICHKDARTGLEKYWRFPLETLYDLEGDSNCKTILAAALFKLLFRMQPKKVQRDVVLLVSKEEADMALAVEAPHEIGGEFYKSQGLSYYFCRFTPNGFWVGEVPQDFAYSRYLEIHLDDKDPGEWALDRFSAGLKSPVDK